VRRSSDYVGHKSLSGINRKAPRVGRSAGGETFHLHSNEAIVADCEFSVKYTVRYIQPVLTSRDDCSDFENQDWGTMNYLDDVIMPSFGPRAIRSKCHVVGADVRSNWLEQHCGSPPG
jgi:hypothetical protein